MSTMALSPGDSTWVQTEQAEQNTHPMSGIITRLLRFMEKLPETRTDIDLEAFKRFPVPI